MTIITRTAVATCVLALATSTTNAQGNTAEFAFPMKSHAEPRHGWIYTPAGYPGTCGAGCNLILAFDGAMYLGAMPIPEILDSLIYSRRIPPTVAVLFDNGA